MMSSERFHERGEDLQPGDDSVGTNHESVFRSFASRYKPDVVMCVYKLGTGDSNGGVGSWGLRGEGMGDFLRLTVQLM